MSYNLIYKTEPSEKILSPHPNGLIHKTDTEKVIVYFTVCVINALDEEAKKIGVTRQFIIKVWIAEKLKAESDKETIVFLKRYHQYSHLFFMQKTSSWQVLTEI